MTFTRHGRPGRAASPLTLRNPLDLIEAATNPESFRERCPMPSRRQFLSALVAPFLFAGCGGSGNTDKVEAPPLTPEQQTAADEFKANVQKNMKNGH